MLTSQEIANIINTTYEGIEKSKCGKMTTGERDPNNNIVYNGFALQNYFEVLKINLQKAKDK